MLGKIFGKKREPVLNEDEVRIVVPDENFTLVEYKKDELTCVAMVNTGLDGFEHKDIFGWHLSVIIDFEDVIDNGMPSAEEREVVDPFCDELDENIKAAGNALFLVRETWNKTRRLVWMVYNPEIANKYLQDMIEHESHPRPFDYRMEADKDWKQPEWYLRAIRT